MPSTAANSDGEMVDVTYPTKLTTNLLNALKERKKTTGIPVTVQIRQAVERDLKEGADSSKTEQPTFNAPSGDWEKTLRAAFTDVFHSVPVSVDRVRRGKLQDLADQLGFASAEDFLQTMAFQAIEHPKSAASFLFADIEESAIVSAQTEAHHKTRSSKTSSKAA